MGTDLSIKVIQRLESCSSLGIDRGVVFPPSLGTVMEDGLVNDIIKAILVTSIQEAGI